MFGFTRKKTPVAVEQSANSSTATAVMDPPASFTPPAPVPATPATPPAPPPPPVKTPEQIEAERAAAAKAELLSEFVAIENIGGLFCLKPENRPIEHVEADIERTEQLLVEVKERHGSAIAQLLPVEADLKQRLDSKKVEIDKTLQAKLASLRKELTAARLDGEYNRIDMGFLKKRKYSEKYKAALPLFALFSIDNPLCSFSYRVVNSWQDPAVQSTVPSQLVNLFDLKAVLAVGKGELARKYYSHGLEVMIVAKFTGAIPQPVRQIINEAKPKFDAVLLVTEAPEWEVAFHAVPQPPPQRDPLVIGMKDNTFWLITAFDTTPAEEEVRREFTFGELKS